jgi:hypothetical protein
MGSFADFLELELLDHVFGNAAYTAPATLYVALYTVTPTDASASGTEVTGGSYARVAVTNNATNWPAASGGAKANGTAITFPAPTANWGTVVAFAIYDAATVGNELAWGALTVNKTINNGDAAPSFAVGDLDITLD